MLVTNICRAIVLNHGGEAFYTIAMKTAFLFPGQGAQYPGMAKDLHEASAEVRRLFEAASDILGKDLKRLLFEGSEDELKVTDNTQAAVTLTNIAAAQVLAERGIKPDFCAGFSVGEYAALYQSGILDLESLFKAVAIRGEAMEKASRLADRPEGPSGMSAVLGLPFADAAAVMAGLAAKNSVYIANHSSPVQIVIAGTSSGLDVAEAALKAAGARRAIRLKVGGPFHTPLLAAASEEFAARTAGLTFRDPVLPLISNVTALPIPTGSEARELAAAQIQTTVRWVDSMAWLKEHGVSRIIEVGPGKVLGGLWKAFTADSICLPAGTIAEVESIES